MYYVLTTREGPPQSIIIIKGSLYSRTLFFPKQSNLKMRLWLTFINSVECLHIGLTTSLALLYRRLEPVFTAKRMLSSDFIEVIKTYGCYGPLIFVICLKNKVLIFGYLFVKISSKSKCKIFNKSVHQLMSTFCVEVI